jgi:hypothetical protein
MTHEHTYRFYIRQGEFELDVEGDRNFVESYVAAFLAGEAEIDKLEPARKAVKGRTGKTKAGKGGSPQIKIDKEALLNFVKGKKLPSDGKRYLAYAAFLKTQGINEINAGYIRQCYKILGIAYKPTSRQNLFLMKRYGKVVSGSQPGFYSLTDKGEKEASKLGKRAVSKKAAGRRKRAVRPRKTAKK